MEVNGQLHTPGALPSGVRSQYPLYRKLGGTQSRLDVLETREILWEIELLFLGRPVRRAAPLLTALVTAVDAVPSGNPITLPESPSSHVNVFMICKLTL
jgi:hypothetical protein